MTPEVHLITMININEDFDGVFRFTNPTEEEFTFFWNNKEYIYPAMSTCPMIIANETLENIQEIRKRAAYNLAVREFYKSAKYFEMSKMGNGLPPTFDDKILEPMIEQCLKPLPIARPIVKDLPKMSERKFKGSKAVSGKDDLNAEFKDAEIQELGKMSENFTV